MPEIKQLDDDAYFAAPGVSRSMLADFVEGKSRGRSRALVIGSAFDTWVFGGLDRLRAQYFTLGKEIPLNTKDGKAAIAEAERKQGGRTALRPSESAIIVGMFKAIRGQKTTDNGQAAIVSKADALLRTQPGRDQLCVFAELEGVACKGKIDRVLDTEDGDVLIDLKSTGYLDEGQFVDSIVKFGYAAQAAFYWDLWVAATEKQPRAFVNVCVSKGGAHLVWIVKYTPEQLAFGRKWYTDILKLYERFGNATQSEHRTGHGGVVENTASVETGDQRRDESALPI